MPVFYNSPGTSDALFSWLKNQFDGSMKFMAEFTENSGNAKSYGCVSIVAAGMHDTIILGTKSVLCGKMCFFRTFLYGKSINIKSKCYNRSRAAV